MPIGEAIVGAIAEMIGYVIVELIIGGIGKMFRALYYGIRKLFTGKDREMSELDRIEKRYLFKKFKLRSDFSGRIQRGTSGTVMAVIDDQSLYVEFEDTDGKPITDGGITIFKIDRKKVILEPNN